MQSIGQLIDMFTVAIQIGIQDSKTQRLNK